MPVDFPPAAAAVEVGGLYGINVETLADNKTLTPRTDKIYQYLDEGDADRIITLDTGGAIAGDRFVIRHNGVSNDTNHLEVKQAATSLDKIYAGGIKEFIFDGTNWTSRGIGTGENDNKKFGVAVGYESMAHTVGAAFGKGANASSAGAALGLGADGHDNGAALGQNADGYGDGVGIGFSADGHSSGVAIGGDSQGINGSVAVGQLASATNRSIAIGNDAWTNGKYQSIAIGFYSITIRVGETSININGDDTDQENNVVQGRWEGETADATPLEIFCAGQAGERFLIRNNSVLAFRMIITARDNAANEVAMYTVNDGLVKKAGDGTAAVLAATTTVTVVKAEDAGWDCVVAVDVAGNNLIITVTGDATNPVQWAAVMDGVETHFGA